MSKQSFQKFISPEISGAKKKEVIKQQKRKAKKERSDAINQRKAEKYAERQANPQEQKQQHQPFDFRKKPTENTAPPKSSSYASFRENAKPKPFPDKKRKENTVSQKPAWVRKNESEKAAQRAAPKPYIAKEKRPDYPQQKPVPFKKSEVQVPAPKRTTAKPASEKVDRPKPIPVKENRGKFNQPTPTPFRKKEVERTEPNRETAKPAHHKPDNRKSTFIANKKRNNETATVQKKVAPVAINTPSKADEMALNKFIAYSGVCGRREAAELVKAGHVTVNKVVVTEPGSKVAFTDVITVKDKQIFLQKNPVYILLNKPKDFITTSDDPQGRKTVLDLIKGATKERVFPVGRLDRNTTGVLLLTNDGELTQKLTHPSFEIKKIYEVHLDKPVTKKHLDEIATGVVLDDGFVKADAIAYAHASDKSIVGIELHSGKNRVVRRIFEQLGYDVRNLDRVFFANLTKKNVERGRWRFLSEKEVRLLKFMNQSFIKKTKEVVAE